MTIRPPSGYVLVRRLLPETLALHSTSVAIPATVRAPPCYVADVVACPADVTAVMPGQRVIVQSQSGHPFQSEAVVSHIAELLGLGDDARLSLVPCRVLPAPIREAEYVRRGERVSAIRRLLPRESDLPRLPKDQREAAEALAMEAEDHMRERAQIKAMRCRGGRSRLFKPVQDPARSEGILAVIEES